MRHAKKRHRLGRTASHRKATLQALSAALIRHKRITTTETKAKALRVFIEPIITRAKEDTTHNRREAFRHLQDKEAVHGLFEEVVEAVGDRPGGYTRVIKLGKRSGDAAELAVIELVDFNDVKPEGGGSSKKRTRRGGGRGRRRSKATAETPEPAVQDEEVVLEDEGATDEVAGEEAVKSTEDKAEESTDEVEAEVMEEDVDEGETEEQGEEAAKAEVDDATAEAEADVVETPEDEAEVEAEESGDEGETEETPQEPVDESDESGDEEEEKDD